MMLALEHFDTQAQKLTRWTTAAGIIVAAHAIIAVAIWHWSDEPPNERQQPGAIMMELPALAAESASDQTDLSEKPEVNTSAPPPSPSDDVADKPSETEPEKMAEPTETSPEPTAVAAAEPPAEQPPVEEAPLAPEPEVALPKIEEPKPQKPKEEKTEKKAESKPEKPKAEKPAPKSESKQQRQAQASASGRFDPNPIYRPSPAYPASARASKIEGYVVVSYSVSASGSVSNVRVVSASPPGVFNSSAASAVQQWRFKPSPSGAGGRSTTIRFKLR